MENCKERWRVVGLIVVLLIFIADICYTAISPEDFFWFAFVMFLGSVCLIGLCFSYLRGYSELEEQIPPVQNYGSINAPYNDLPPRYSTIVVVTETPALEAIAAREIDYKEKLEAFDDEELPSYEAAMSNKRQ